MAAASPVTPGYTGVGGWNSYAAFLLGLMSSYGKSVQFEEMTGRENQYGFYITDRWQVNDKLTVNLGLRYEYYPLMSRADRGFEQLDFNTFMIKLGGLGGNPKDLGIKVDKALFAPRLGLAYRLNDNTVFRAGYGKTFNPLPWSRPMRGFYPATIAYSDAGINGFIPTARWPPGIPGAPNPDIAAATSRCRAASTCGRPIRTTSSAAPSTRGTSSSSAACPSTSRQRRLRRHGDQRRLCGLQPELRRVAAATPTASSSRRRERRHPAIGRRARRRATTRCRWR